MRPVSVERRGGKWCVVVSHGDVVAVVARYTAKYRAVAHAATLAGIPDDEIES